MNQEKSQKVPLVKGFLINDQGCNPTIVFWCPFCRCYHRHGWQEPTDMEIRFGSHRVAHCKTRQSPFRSTGYYIRPFTEKDQIVAAGKGGSISIIVSTDRRGPKCR